MHCKRGYKKEVPQKHFFSEIHIVAVRENNHQKAHAQKEKQNLFFAVVSLSNVISS